MISMARTLGAPEGVYGGKVLAESAFDGADDVHYVAVTFDEHQAIDFHASKFGHAAHVVAAEVDEHDVFGALLVIVHHFPFEALILFFGCAAGACAGDRAVLDLAVVDANEEFGGGAGEFDCLGRFGFLSGAEGAIGGEAEEVHVGTGVHGAQGAVDLEAVHASGDVEPLREDGLEDISCCDVLLGAFDG
jgi:hypothetical protein